MFGGDRRLEKNDSIPDAPIDFQSVNDNKKHVTEFLPFIAEHEIDRLGLQLIIIVTDLRGLSTLI
jgi:hypothetical protein